MKTGIPQMLLWIGIGDCWIKGEKGLRDNRIRRILVDGWLIGHIGYWIWYALFFWSIRIDKYKFCDRIIYS